MPTQDDTQTGKRRGLFDQARSLATVLGDEFGVPFQVVRASDGGDLLDNGDPAEKAHDPERDWVVPFGEVEQARVLPLPAGGYRLALSLHDNDRPGVVAFARMGSIARLHPDTGREEVVRLEKWLRAIFDHVRAAGRSGPHHRPAPARPAPGPDPWEVIVRLEQLMKLQKTHQDPLKDRKRTLRAAAGLVPVQCLAYVPTRSNESAVHVGEDALSPWDWGQLSAALTRSGEWQETGLLLYNDISMCMWSARFPQVRALLAFPILDGAPIGWLIALNKRAQAGANGPRDGEGTTDQSAHRVVPFRRTDAAMLAPFASLLGQHARAFQSYNHLREILVGLTRSLTAAIDAKDSYTFGHSERVARIAVEIGRALGLQDDELSDIYLAGLLHDIGKIGIRDEVLGKTTPLTEAEFEHMKEHVTIGYRILSGLNAIAHLLPGVLYHHERYDGRGYPEGLKGNEVPFLARIVAVADSYDAMCTSRPYRAGLPCDRVEQVLLDGAGKQWDKAVVDAFMRCKDRVHAIRQRGVGESLRGALDDALRKGAGRQTLSSVVGSLI